MGDIINVHHNYRCFESNETRETETSRQKVERTIFFFSLFFFLASSKHTSWDGTLRANEVGGPRGVRDPKKDQQNITSQVVSCLWCHLKS